MKIGTSQIIYSSSSVFGCTGGPPPFPFIKASLYDMSTNADRSKKCWNWLHPKINRTNVLCSQILPDCQTLQTQMSQMRNERVRLSLTGNRYSTSRARACACKLQRSHTTVARQGSRLPDLWTCLRRLVCGSLRLHTTAELNVTPK